MELIWGKEKFQFSRQVLLHHLPNEMCKTNFMQTDFIKHIAQLLFLPEILQVLLEVSSH
jgi:hypothetical protein